MGQSSDSGVNCLDLNHPEPQYPLLEAGYHNSTHLKGVIVRMWSGIMYPKCLAK